jgi:hypothetical protein
MITMPVTAKINVTHLPDGSTRFSNGTYWITWDPIGEHVVGDKFFINATTNLSAGTEFEYTFTTFEIICHQKVCNDSGWGTGGFTTIVTGDTTQYNHISIWIDTTGFRSGNYYFKFLLATSNISTEYNAFYDGRECLLDNNLLSLPTTQTPIPTKTFIPVSITVVALLGSAFIFIMIKKREKFP